jgi:BNR repeat-like domain
MRACLLAPLVLLLSCHADWENAAQFQPPALAMLVWHGSTDIAVGRAERGAWRMNESRYDYVDDPTVAIDERGGIAVAWVDQARKDVLFQRFSADGRKLGQWVNVSRSPAVFSWLPRIVVDSKQGVFVLWQEIIFSGGSHGGDILFARSEDGGRTFSAPVNLSSSIAGDGKGRINKDYWHNGSLDLALGADGTLYVAWTEYEGALWVRRSRDGGRTFSGRLRISEAKPARGPALALGPNGIVYLAWTVGDEAADIRVVKSTDGGGSFGAPVIVERSKGYSDAPKLAVDAAGALHLVYAARQRILYSRSTDGARSFAAPRDISGANAGFPALSLDGKGNLYVLWERFADSPVRPRGLALALSNDGGGTFAEPVLVPDSADAGWNGSSQGLLMRKLAVNRHGAFAIVNSSFEDKERSRVWLIRGQLKRDST